MKKGMTLIELAIILVIIGILLSIGVSILAVMIKHQKLKETKNMVQTLCETVKSYAITNKTLPSSIQNLGVKTKDPYGQDIKYVYALGADTNNICENDPTSWVNLTDKGNFKNKVLFLIYSISENRHDDTFDRNVYEIKPSGAFYNGYEYDDITCYIDINTIRKKACSPLEITTQSLPKGIQFLSYPPTTITASAQNITCDITGLPRKLVPSNCSISGVPLDAGAFQVNVSVTDNIGRTSTRTFGLVIQPNPVQITTPYLPYAYKNKSYSISLTAIGGSGQYIWEIISGVLPSGLTFLNGKIYGTPTQTGSFDITIQAKDAIYYDRLNNYSFDTKNLSISVLEAPNTDEEKEIELEKN
ncbi:MAG: hypothetical protein GXO21_08600 [Aquificae bacterium]|nr:hypothetical protein [Aquificota bacterium]